MIDPLVIYGRLVTFDDKARAVIDDGALYIGAGGYHRRRGHTTNTDRPVARGAPMELGAEKFEVFFYLADERGERTYVTEHHFLERPDVETVKCLFDEARRHFSVLYEGDATPEDFEVRVTYSENEDSGCF